MEFERLPSGRRFLDLFSKEKHWHSVSTLDRLKSQGSRFLLCNGEPLQRVLMTFFPEFDWKPWLFSRVPWNFWNCEAHRREYIEWLARERGIRSLDDWYRVQSTQVKEMGGSGFIDFYDGSFYRAMSTLYPSHSWKAWLFERVGCGFWDKEVGFPIEISLARC